MIMVADGCTRGSDQWHFSTERDEIKVGDVIAGPGTPIVWPRADGDFPDVPAPLPDVLHQFAAKGSLPSR
jgi:hypothetical protein